MASRKLKAGTLIIEEDPVLCAPRGLVEDFSTPICLTCCVLMEDEKASYRCSRCNWPTCCKTCEQVSGITGRTFNIDKRFHFKERFNLLYFSTNYMPRMSARYYQPGK